MFRHVPDNYDPDRFSMDPDSGLYTPRTFIRPEKKPEKKPIFKIGRLSLYKLLTLGLALATLIFLIIYTMAARQTVAEMQRQTRLDERPWIRLITPLALPDDISVGQLAEFHAHVMSLGKTPSKQIHGRMTAEIVREDEPVKLDFEHFVEMQSGIMFPTQDQPVALTVYNAVDDKARDVVAEPRPVTKEEVDLLKSGKAEVFIYGDFTFTDVFGTNHWFKFCAAQSKKQERTLKDWDAKQSCVKYNDTDNN